MAADRRKLIKLDGEFHLTPLNKKFSFEKFFRVRDDSDLCIHAGDMDWVIQHSKKTPSHKPQRTLLRYCILQDARDSEILQALPSNHVLLGPWEIAMVIKRHMEGKENLLSMNYWDLFYGDGFMVRTYYHHGRKARRISAWSPGLAIWHPGNHVFVESH
jgi:hypothetical protein